MRSRPWPLVLLAVFQLLSPFGTILFNSWALGVHPSYVVKWMFQAKPLLVFQSVFLMPLAGIAIYSMKRWSYGVFWALMAWSFGSNVMNWGYAKRNFESLGFWMLLGVYAIQVALVIYFVIPSVRRTYLDPRVRWWESKRRYLLEIPVSLFFGGQGNEKEEARQGTLQNLSEAGALLSGEDDWPDEGTRGELRFEVLGHRFRVPAEIVRRPTGTELHGAGSYGCALRFRHSQESARTFERLARGLELVGVEHRDAEGAKLWYLSLRDWLATLFRTGRGLTPELNPSRQSGERRPGPPAA